MRAQAVPQTQASYVYDAIKGEILSGELRGGQTILQADWAERMGTSVTPVREAIRRLGQDGLVESAPHRGTRVVEFSIEALEEIYTMRILLEPLQLQHTRGRITPTDAKLARSLCDAMEALEDHEVAEFIDLNIQFHTIIFAHDESWTSRVVDMLQAAASPYVSVSIAQNPAQLLNSNKDHYEILDAVIEGNIDHATAVNERHIRSTLELAREYLQGLGIS